MAEPPPNGLFWFAADDAARRVEFDGDHVVIDVALHGPAGVSSVDLPAGGLLQVDHLDPTHLVGVESDLIESGSSPLLVALFGGDGALRIVDRDQPADLLGDGDSGEEPWNGGRTRGRAVQLDQDAQSAGRLIVLADLADDPAADPLARVVAAAEFIGDLDVTPGGDLFVPMVPHLVDRAVAAAGQVDDDSLLALDGAIGVQIAAALRALVAAALTRRDRSLLLQLVERIEQLAGRDSSGLRGAALMVPSEPDYTDLAVDEDRFEDEMGSPTFADAASQRASAPAVRFVRRSPSLLEVTVPRSDELRWVRAVRSDGLVTVALAPLHRDGLMESAELLVPPDTYTDDLGLQLVAAGELHQIAGAPADLVRRAVRSGRAAASAERYGDHFESTIRWERCSALWRLVGDDRRARQAMDRGSARGGRVLVGPILADELDPYGADAQLERADHW